MSDSEVPFSDILEEHERSSIRGTLMHLAQQQINAHRRSSAVTVDPYMRECSIWIRPGMTRQQVVARMRDKLGLEQQEDGSYKAAGSSKFNVIRCHYASDRLERVEFLSEE